MYKVTAKANDGTIIEDEYNTVSRAFSRTCSIVRFQILLAIGRDAVTDDLNLDALHVKRNSKYSLAHIP